MNVNNVLRSYGFRGGVFSLESNSPVFRLDPINKRPFGRIESNITIDTPKNLSQQRFIRR
jgi:hypothetical protein